MAAPFVSLALQGIGPAVNNYDNVKDKVKKVPVPQKLKPRKYRDNGDRSYDQRNGDDDYDRPRRSNTEGSKYNQRDGHDGGYQKYRNRSPPQYNDRPRTRDGNSGDYGRDSRPRARSAGPNNYGGSGGRGLKRGAAVGAAAGGLI